MSEYSERRKAIRAVIKGIENPVTEILTFDEVFGPSPEPVKQDFETRLLKWGRENNITIDAYKELTQIIEDNFECQV